MKVMNCMVFHQITLQNLFKVDFQSIQLIGVSPFLASQGAHNPNFLSFVFFSSDSCCSPFSSSFININAA